MISNALMCVSFGFKQMKRSKQLQIPCVHREWLRVERTVKKIRVEMGTLPKRSAPCS